MSSPPAKLKELRQYIKDFEVGVAMRLDDLGARLAATERNLAAIGRRLAELFDTDERAADGHA